MQSPLPVYDELVGLGIDEIAAGMTPERRRRFHEQLVGIAVPAIVPSGLRPFMRLPAPEAATLTRARMASTIANLVAANGAVSRDDLIAAGFDEVDIIRHFRAALRASGAERMAV